ncbi:MAG: CotH kinase family protein [Bacteroidetes bacterium]|nr:CotH kinase family protein [Bacteroidota bacterium]
MRYFLIFIILLPVFIFSGKAQPGGIDHWEMLVEAGNLWNYFPGTEEPPADWRDLLFDDTEWSQGPGGIGYGDGDDATIIDPVGSLYMRQLFTVDDPAEIVGALLYIDYDDGFVAYLNGIEIARGNIGLPGWIPPFNAYADNDTHEAQLYQGGEPEHFGLNAMNLDTLLTAGNNVLAIQIHNCNATSSDLSAIPYFFAGTTDTTNTGGSLPDWFDENDFEFSTHLPIMAIDAYGQQIPDDPRIIANLKVYNNPNGQMNSILDEPTGYDGIISIETRGASSQMFDKKSYSFETQLASGENNNVELLGLPSENDWILYGPYSDKSLLRNVLIMQLAREMGWYASRTVLCEVLLNGDYRGIYVLMEKIKRDNNRVDINDLDGNDNAGDSLTGGYIVKIDWPDNGNTYDWQSPVHYFNGDYLNLNYQYEYPDRDEITGPQAMYIENFVSSFEEALIGGNFMNIQEGYRKYIDVHSFADYFILNEIANNVDAYRLSNFLTKVRDSKGGKLFEGPIWDFNLGFGNCDFGNAWQTFGWALSNPFVVEIIPFHLKRLRQDPSFRNLTRCRWDELRTSTLSEDHMDGIIDSLITYLGPAIERNFDRWNILGTYVWPNYYVGNTYQDEIDYLKGFIDARLSWIDNNLTGISGDCQSIYNQEVVVSEIKYQVADEYEPGDWFELFNNSSSTIDLSGWIIKDENNLNTFTLPPGSMLNPGHHLVICSDLQKFSSIFPYVGNVVGSFNWKLGQNDRIRIYDTDGLLVCEINYKEDGAWPILPEGLGYTLELTNPAEDLNDPSNWFTGCPGGSPGSAYFLPCPNLSVSEIRKESLIVYPNPARDFLTIKLKKQEKVKISILTIDGKIMKHHEQNAKLIELDIRDLNTGIYFVKVTGESDIWVRRIVIE